MEEERIVEVRRRRWPRRVRRGLLVFLIALLLLFLAVWLLRVRIATEYIDRELERRGVQATYDVTRIGFGSQILENLVIGDPDDPDLTARRVEVQVLLGWRGPRVGLITARGVRMRGRVEDGRLSLGEVDKLLPPPSGLPFRLPDQRVDIADSAILLDTPAGRLALGLNGRGNLSDGFRGSLALVSRGLALGECRIDVPTARLRVAVDDLRPRFTGPLAMDRLVCGDDLAVTRPRMTVDATLAPGIDAWRGNADGLADRLAAGPHAMERVRARLGFEGDAARTAGTVDLGSGPASVDMFRAANMRLTGRYSLSPRHGDIGIEGDLAVDGLRVEAGRAEAFARALRSADGTPVGPIGDSLAGSLLRALRGGARAEARLQLANARGTGSLRLEQLRVDARSGASLRALGGEGIGYAWPSGVARIDGAYALEGGGLPSARFQLSQASPGGPIRGTGRIAPMAAGGARLALGDIAFTASPDGRTSFRTVAEMSGPIAGGRIDGLRLPIDGRFGRGGFAIGESCIEARFSALRLQGLRLGPTRLPLCPVGDAIVQRAPGGRLRAGARMRDVRLAGRLGGSALAMGAGRVRVGLEGLEAADVAVRLGEGGSANQFRADSIGGRFVSRGVEGDFAGLEAVLAAVPLRVEQGRGTWQVVRGDLAMQGHVRVVDRADPVRFHALESDDFRLTLADNRIRATGWLHHPSSGTRVTEATISHDLRTGRGEAVLDVPGIAFNPGFQPEALTPLTIGVVALVDGTLRGQGRIEWDEAGTRSTGTFATAGMNLAAPFGPVEGLTTSIHFTDLLGLASAPGQVARIDLVRAGIDVHDGTIRYQLRPNSHVAIESGRWPFAGGELFLEPTLLDFSQESVKYLTFRVAGLDAARFVQQMEFSNIAATGTFDGVIPMQFSIRGGRIVDGRLSARPEGGTLSYVGELSDRDLGPYGILAFNALKSLRYDKFDITLNGALDGEFLTIIDLDGIARDPAGTTLPSGGAITEIIAARVFRQVSNIPFEFNIRIQGQFRALIATARSFSDPTPLIQSVLPQMLRERSTTVSDVQDEESEPVQ